MMDTQELDYHYSYDPYEDPIYIDDKLVSSYERNENYEFIEERGVTDMRDIFVKNRSEFLRPDRGTCAREVFDGEKMRLGVLMRLLDADLESRIAEGKGLKNAYVMFHDAWGEILRGYAFGRDEFEGMRDVVRSGKDRVLEFEARLRSSDLLPDDTVEMWKFLRRYMCNLYVMRACENLRRLCGALRLHILDLTKDVNLVESFKKIDVDYFATFPILARRMMEKFFDEVRVLVNVSDWSPGAVTEFDNKIDALEDMLIWHLQAKRRDRFHQTWNKEHISNLKNPEAWFPRLTKSVDFDIYVLCQYKNNVGAKFFRWRYFVEPKINYPYDVLIMLRNSNWIQGVLYDPLRVALKGPVEVVKLVLSNDTRDLKAQEKLAFSWGRIKEFVACIVQRTAIVFKVDQLNPGSFLGVTKVGSLLREAVADFRDLAEEEDAFLVGDIKETARRLQRIIVDLYCGITVYYFFTQAVQLLTEAIKACEGKAFSGMVEPEKLRGGEAATWKEARKFMLSAIERVKLNALLVEGSQSAVSYRNHLNASNASSVVVYVWYIVEHFMRTNLAYIGDNFEKFKRFIHTPPSLAFVADYHSKELDALEIRSELPDYLKRNVILRSIQSTGTASLLGASWGRYRPKIKGAGSRPAFMLVGEYRSMYLNGCDEWYMMEKYDGYRFMWHGPSKSFYFRNVEASSFRPPPQIWTDTFVKTFADAVIDGELYAGIGNFTKIPSCLSNEYQNLRFIAFDIIENSKMRFDTRYRRLRELIAAYKSNLIVLAEAKPILFKHSSSEKERHEIVEARKARFVDVPKCEGVILRASDGDYECGKRSHKVLKIKFQNTGLARLVYVNYPADMNRFTTASAVVELIDKEEERRFIVQEGVYTLESFLADTLRYENLASGMLFEYKSHNGHSGEHQLIRPDYSNYFLTPEKLIVDEPLEMLYRKLKNAYTAFLRTNAKPKETKTRIAKTQSLGAFLKVVKSENVIRALGSLPYFVLNAVAWTYSSSEEDLRQNLCSVLVFLCKKLIDLNLFLRTAKRGRFSYTKTKEFVDNCKSVELKGKGIEEKLEKAIFYFYLNECIAQSTLINGAVDQSVAFSEIPFLWPPHIEYLDRNRLDTFPECDMANFNQVSTADVAYRITAAYVLIESKRLLYLRSFEPVRVDSVAFEKFERHVDNALSMSPGNRKHYLQMVVRMIAKQEAYNSLYTEGNKAKRKFPEGHSLEDKMEATNEIYRYSSKVWKEAMEAVIVD